jgi:hypothetical protein
MLNSRDINLLRSDVTANCRKLIALAKEQGLDVLVTGTVRDEEYQLYCYKKGYTNAKTPSFHSVRAGLAFDICKNVKGHEYDDDAFWTAVGAVGQKIGFTWGGAWKRVIDNPHFQWDANGTVTDAMVRSGAYPPPMPLYMTDTERYKTVIQAHCRFSNPDGVFSLTDKSPYAEALYKKWAESYK